MSWLSKILGFIGDNSGLFSGALSTAQQYNQNKFNASEAEKNRSFQSDEAALNRMFQSNEAALQRDWSSQEAERARDWQEEMNAKYNSISGKIAQAEEAGVNPMYAVTGNAVSPVSASASAPSGSSAGSPGLPSGSAASAQFVDIIGAILNAKKTRAEIDLMASEEEKNRKEAERTGWLAKLSEREYNVIVDNNFDVREIESRLQLSADQANQAFQLAGKYFEEAGKIAEERHFLEKTADDREKIVQYERLISEFESSLSSSLDSLSDKEKLSLKEWVSLIFKGILVMK